MTHDLVHPFMTHDYLQGVPFWAVVVTLAVAVTAGLLIRVVRRNTRR